MYAWGVNHGCDYGDFEGTQISIPQRLHPWNLGYRCDQYNFKVSQKGSIKHHKELRHVVVTFGKYLQNNWILNPVLFYGLPLIKHTLDY